jgi:ABC-type nickel/cobalt efflux system permease component RcnA
MNSTTVFRFLILVIPAVWVIVRLLPAEHPRYGNLRAVAQQAQDHQSHQEADQFVSYESLFKAHYQSHYATSGYDYSHYRLAYKYGFDLAHDPDNQKMDWKTIEPLARQNWDEGVMGRWSQHGQAILYGWEQGVKINTGSRT